MALSAQPPPGYPLQVDALRREVDAATVAREAIEQELREVEQSVQELRAEEEAAARAFHQALAVAAEACRVVPGELAVEAQTEGLLEARLAAARAQRPEVAWKEDRRAGDMSRRFRDKFSRQEVRCDGRAAGTPPPADSMF